jgi:hypothetical protein
MGTRFTNGPGVKQAFSHRLADEPLLFFEAEHKQRKRRLAERTSGRAAMGGIDKGSQQRARNLDHSRVND